MNSSLHGNTLNGEMYRSGAKIWTTVVTLCWETLTKCTAGAKRFYYLFEQWMGYSCAPV